ncbi:nonribosomal peptide synthase Pes1 [Usnea florida]
MDILASTLDKVLKYILSSPNTQLVDLDYVSERHRGLIDLWSQDPHKLSSKCVHDLIHEQVLQRPDHEAVCAWDGSLTYHDLWVHVERIAQALSNMGVGPEVIVPLCFEKSMWTTVAILAVLKAGAGFCLLDATQPISRLQSLTRKLASNTLLCSRTHYQVLSSLVKNVVLIDAEALRNFPEGSSDPRTRASSSSNIVYVVFTSGSTGEPKAIVIEHGAYCSAFEAQKSGLCMESGLRALQYASYVFDASIQETLNPLMLGGTVCIPSEKSRINDLAATINDMRVDWAVLTPSVANFFTPSAVPRLKTLLLVGEAMSRENFATWSSIKLLNGYGPAECCVAAVANSDLSVNKDITQIGRGIGVRCWLVDPQDHNRLLPPGCVAELLIEGPTLARGYLNDLQRTRDSFIENPAWAAIEAAEYSTIRRMYKTGDLVRYNTSNGMLHFVGRKDNQVKLHGQRIELGEIEYHLANEPSVQQSVVLVPKAGFCRNRLVAVICLHPRTSASSEMGALRFVDEVEQEEAQPTIATARERLSHRLPTFMIPSIWLVVRSIPLLKSAKLDRKTVLSQVQGMSEETYTQWVQGREKDENPTTELEARLRSVWGDVLNLQAKQVGLNQSFLSLGGDSISAMMVQSRCKKNKIGVTVQDILRAKSLRHLATLAGAIGQSVKEVEVIEEDFDLSPIQSLYFQFPDRKGHFNQSVFVRLTKVFQPGALQQTAKAIVHRHSMLRARFRLSAFDDEWKQRITTDVTGSYTFRVHQCSSREEAEPLMFRTQASLNPVNGPLFAMDLFNIEGGDQLLFMTAHHLVVDLVSWRVILQDVEDFLTHPTSASDAQPSLSFQTWCKRQLEHAHKIPLNSVLPASDVPRQSFDYWDIQEGENTYGNVACEGFELDSLATTFITSKCHQALHTDTVDVLIAAMMYSFTQTFTDRGPPTIFNEGHGREPWESSIELSRTIGWFTSMYPIHVQSLETPDFLDTLKRVKDFRRAVPANGRPYFASRLLTSKGGKKFGNHWPLEFTFNYLGVYQQLEREDALLLPVKELAGEARGAGGNSDVGQDTPRFGLFEISAVIAQGKLRFSFTFNRRMSHQEKIRAWVSACRETLTTAPPNLAKMAYQPTLSDFPLISMTYNGLQQLFTDRLPQIGISDIRYVEDIYRCSQIQQGLLISRQKDAGFYAIHGTYRVSLRDGTRVDSNKVAHAWQKVVNRHPSLRTIFVESLSQEDALYDQVVLRKVEANTLRLDCETETDALRLLSSQQPMEYNERKPSHRFTICETLTHQVICKLELSHVIVDGSSISTIFRELAFLYEGKALSDTGPLYSNYIAFLQRQPLQAGIGYWKSYLAEVQSTIFPILSDTVYMKRELRSKRIPVDDILEVQKFCNLHGVTMANVFHTAWALTLQAYTGSHDVCFGYLMSTRDDSIEQVEDLVGYLVNMLVCRVTLSPETPLIAIMQQVQTDLSDGQAHRQTALSEVLHALKIAGSSLFNTSLSYRKLPPKSTGQKSAISFDECFPYYDPTEYSVSINIEVAEESAAVDLDYWSDCLSDEHATNVTNTFLQSLKNVLHHSESYIRNLYMVSESDERQMRVWNSCIPETIEKCVHEVVGEQMTRRPDASAIKAWDAELTYAELDALAGRLAGYLSLFGVTSGSYVCLCFEKSAYTIVGMLGVLKAGGAFVALDPMHPMAALELRIKDTQARVILTSPCFTTMFTAMDVHAVGVDQVFLDKLQRVQHPLSSSVKPDDPCCVIYTSGSTGKPKGVILEHRALVTSSYAHGSALGISRDTRFLQFASYTFDNNLEEIFTTLQRGGTVCVPSDQDRLNDLPSAVSKLNANFMDLTPTVATYLNPAEMPTIKGVALGGEALTKAVLEVWGDKVEIHNQYGPSECSINSTHRSNIGKSSDPSNIGRSVGSVSWIVDPMDHNRLVAIGCEGELLIEGPILARGYLNNMEKTSEVFIENPKWARSFEVGGSQKSRRMYKTGDLVRYNSDGTIAYIGRKDQQVKLHGQRIELGEIEFHVRTHLEADWHYAVELITPGQGSTKALALFACPQGDDSVRASVPENGLLPLSTMLLNTFKTLEASLAKTLPKHMVPALYIPMANLPLTSSGKLDRKQLHAHAKSMTDSQVAMFRLAGSSGREPSTDIEKTLAGLWESVLRLDPGSIGMDAQFFRMGGDSIAAIRLVTAARAKAVSLTVADIFRNATLSEMSTNASFSDTVTSGASQNGPQPFTLLPPSLPTDRVIGEVARFCKVDERSVEDIYPCTSIQEGLIALSSKQDGAYVAQNVYRLSSIDIPKFKRAWEAVVAAEKILRTRIVYTDSLGFLQVVVSEQIDWSESSNLEDLSATERIMPAYNGASLTGYAVVHNDFNEAYFVWTVHHALYDGWSSDLILDKVEAHYKSSDTVSSNEGTSYSTFIRYLSNVDAVQSDRFWQSKLEGTNSPQFPMLPTPNYEPRVTNHLVHTVSLARTSGMEFTAASLIRAAWALTISAYSNSEDVVFGETVTGRDAPVPGIFDMIGPTFATIPVRVHARHDLSIAKYLTYLQDGFTEAMPYQHAGIQRIKRITSDTTKACEFQTLIAINTDAPEASNNFWQVETLETDSFFTYALTVSFDVNTTEVEVSSHYDPGLLPEWHLKRLIRYFESVLVQLNSKDAHSLTLADVRTIHGDDRTSIQQWNRAVPKTVRGCIHGLIYDQVQTLPHSTPAICSWDVQLTYRELEDLATSFASHLSELGIGHRSFVPICFEKSALTIIVMLAVLKVGAGFVAIDGGSPKTRLQSIVSDVEAKTILCSPRFESVCDSLGIPTVLVDLKTITGAIKQSKPLPTCAGSDIAYIIFTSGSTGKPKGTLVPHEAFVSGAFAHGPAMRMSSTSRALQFASYTFDASIVEIFTTLILGGCVCVPDDKARLNNPAKVINDMKVNWALLTPSFAQMISPKDVPYLENLVLGGEAMSQNLLSVWADHTHLINAYGPSECAVVATVNSHVSSDSKSSNIGTAVGGRCFIGNQHDPNELVPVGAIGELLVEGPILARGYLKEPEKTKQAFIRNPKWLQAFYPNESSATRMVYRTGDLVKYAEDGSILYIRRKDNQAKLHGQRLELGEVEHHLVQVPTVQHALAVIPSRGIHDKKLVAVLSFKQNLEACINHDSLRLVSRQDGEAHVRIVRDHVSSRLPPYMVPSNWIVLQDIPLLPSGKLDRRRMTGLVEDMPEDLHRELSGNDPDGAKVHGSELEQQLQLIWAKILHLPVEQVGLDQNFLYLGGDSISALQVASQCRTRGLGVTVQDIMRSQSICHLAERVTLPQSTEYGNEVFDEAFSLSPIQQLFFGWVGENFNHFNQSITVKLAHRQEGTKIAAAFRALVGAHSMLRAHYERQPEIGWIQRLDKEVSSSYRFTEHSGTCSSNRIISLVEQSQKSLDIQHGPVFAVDLFETENDSSQVLSIVAHHLVIDVVSWGILLEDLEALLVSGRMTIPPSLPFQIWSRLQCEHLLSTPSIETGFYDDTPAADYAYWGMVDKVNTYGAVHDLEFQLDEKTTSKLLGPCQQTLQTELIDVLLGSILYSFRRSFPDRISVPAVFNEAHGREPWDSSLDLTRTVGWFTTISPVFLPAEASQDCDIVKVIRWVKDQRSRNVGNGREYFSRRMLTEKGRESFGKHWPMEVAFNYLGQEKQFKRSGAVLQPLDGLSSGSDIGVSVPRFALFEISASIVEGALKVSFSYSRNIQHQTGIQLWGSELENALRHSSDRLLELQPQPTLSSFPLLALSYSAIETLQARLPSIGVSSLADLQDVHGCSPMQQGLLLSQIKNTGQYMYQSIFSASLDGSARVDAGRLSRAWEMVVERHSMLRTVFMESVSQEGLMDQAVLKKTSPRIALLTSDTAMAVRLLQEQKPLGFTEAQPHHQMTICQESSGEVFCKLEMSHALCDGTSIPIILQDLSQAYIDQSRLKEAMRYSQYISHIQQTSRSEDVAYWRHYLDSVEPCYFPVLADGKRGKRELQTLELELEDTPYLQSFCAQHSVTLSNVLQLVWALVLRAYTGNDNVCFGYLSSGRDAPLEGIQDAVGLFISMLVCRMEFSSGVLVNTTLKQIQEDYTQSMAHQAFSLGDIQHELQLSGKSLFNTAFTFQRRPNTQKEKNGQLNFDVVEAYDPSEYDFTVGVEAHSNNVAVHFNYWTDFVSNAQARNISDTYNQVLRSIMRPENPQQTVGNLEFCSDAHKKQVFEWNQQSLPMVDECVHDVIRHQSQSLPPATPAVCSWDGDLTYEELLSLARRLSGRLTKLGVGPEVYVPICFEKSMWAVVAMLGVLQAGGAFVPLEPTHPDSRIKFIMEDVKARVVLTSSKHVEKFTNFTDVRSFVVDASLASEAEPVTAMEHSKPKPENAAYLIFTSGTTGLPKGTIISHRAFATGATEHAPKILMTKTSRVLQFSNLCFDASIMEILTSLITGACVCVPSDEERMNNISGAISRMLVNWTLLTPSVAKVLKPEDVPSLKVLVTGGEAMQAGHIAKWAGKTSIVNAYGPSECAVIATTSIKADAQGHVLNDDPAVIGRAVGCRSWVVDPQDHGRLMPVGSVGELVLQGNTVARGYLNNEKKTSDSFVASPSWMATNIHGVANGMARLIYKTGDLVRYNSDGTIVYISRKDSQIKLNGLRIELGEIEHHVKQNVSGDLHTAVEMVAPAGQQSLLAMFFASSDDRSLSETEHADKDPLLLQMSETAISLCKALKANLAGALPAYMIPSLFIPLSQMPWTVSGKLDRPRLVRMVLSLSKEDTAPFKLASAKNKRSPTTDMEKKLRSLWESVLNLEPASATLDDSFFVLGGDSVQAMRLVAGARNEKISLSVLDIFRTPSLAEMAAACSPLEEEDQTVLKQFGLLTNVESLDQLMDEIVAQCRVEKDELADAYPCSPLQEGLITLSIKQPGAYVAHNVFRLPEAVDIMQFKASWEKAVHDTDILRTRIVHTDMSTFVQVVLKQERIEWFTAESTEHATSAALQLPEHSGSPLMRFTIVGEGKGGARYFVWSIHHALYDGWSMPRMLQRVEDIYFEESLISPRASYSQFIKYLRSTDSQACDRFWKSKFDDLQSSHFPKVSSVDADKAAQAETLKYTMRLPDLPKGTGFTLPTMIRAGWAILMSSHSGSDDVVFGETMTGRDVPVDGIIDMLGPTLTTVPTRIQVNSSITVMEYLQKVYQMAADVIPYQHVGLQHIRRLNAETATACDFQNLLVIQTAEGGGDSKMWDPVNSGVGSNFFTYPLVVECNADATSIHVDAHYHQNVINKWHVERLLRQLESILGQICSATPTNNAKMSDLQVISGDDIEMIRSWNSYQPTVVEQCIQDLFMQQAVLKPQSRAVHAWDGDFTYAELRNQAARLSKHLRRLGVAPEVLVPFCTDKSRWALVAQLGVLMAGGGIVPLDPAHPLTRHSEIVQDTKANILLCSPAYRDRYASMVPTVISIDEQSLSQLPAPGTSTSSEVQAKCNNTAYVIFTSGSTGRPKGVVVEHQAFCTSSMAYCEAMLMSPNSRVFNFASVTFDVGLMENLSPLTIGACVCMPNNEAKMTDTAAAIDSLGATWAFLTPSVANLIDPARVPSLKVLVCGGEAMSKENIIKWADCVTLVNGYGPTEAAVICVANGHVSRDKDPSNIGYAHSNGYAWITEPGDHDRLSPLGCSGELLMEGPLLAREYLHDKIKTDAAFIKDPVWARQFATDSAPARRFYKTGDLVRYNADGSIGFIGRKDNQIKLHGQRIELGEIEHNIELHTKVQHAVALLPKAGLCKKRLVAVLSLSDLCVGSTASKADKCDLVSGEDRMKTAQAQLKDLRVFLSDLIPTYMMPAVWLPIEAVPFMVSGKLDRKKVERWVEDLDQAAYRQVTSQEDKAYDAAPITETVQQLREVWASVFNFPIDKIDPSQSFMGQGGDSLISMTIIARCRKIGITLSLQEVLQSKSLFQLASLVDSRGQSSKTIKATLHEEKTDQVFDLSPVQKMYFQLAGPSCDHTRDGRFNQSQLLRIKRKTEPQTVQKAVEVIVQQHSMFRARFSKNQAGAWQQSISPFATGSYRFREHHVGQVSQILPLLADSQTSLDIEHGPLFAVELLNTEKDGQILSLIAHHLIIDVVSWNTILPQLEDLLSFNVETIEKPLSFQVWCGMQNDHASQRDTSQIKSILPFNIKRADMAFWGISDRANTYADVKHESFLLDRSTSQLALGRSNHTLRTQPVEIFQAALIHSFRNVFPQRSAPTIFNESHGRDAWDTSVDITGTTGWFTTIYPLNVSAESETPSAFEVLKRVKDLRRSIPANGREYFAHRYLTADGRWRFGDHMPMEILLNYTGQSHQDEQSDSLFLPFDIPKNEDDERRTADVGPKATRMALFEISVAATNDQIGFSFMYNKNMRHQDEIQRWVMSCRDTLKSLAEHLVKSKPEPTLSDYPLLPTTYKGLQKHATETFQEVGISSLDEVEDMYVTAPTQDGLLLSQIRNPGQYVNYVISEVQLAQGNSRIDPQRLAKAWQKVVDRHQSLRTAFVYSVCKGHAFDQIALKHASGGAKIVNCEDSQFERELAKVSLKEVNSVRRPMLPHQLTICTTTSGRCYTKLELNHAVIDGGSGALITRDLGLAYQGILPGDPKPLYSDYVRYISSLGEGAGATFWKTYLKDIKRCHLPILNATPGGPKRLNAIYLRFDRFPELQTFCRANSFTLSNVMLAAWGLVLRQYTSTQDVCFGNLTAGRDAPVDGIQDSVGAFINMLVCRVNFSQPSTLKAIIRSVQSDYLESLPHQHCSLAKLQHELGFSGEPLFNTAVSIQNQISTRDAEKEGDAIEIEPISDYDPTEVSGRRFSFVD